jgi:hypothetical protein
MPAGRPTKESIKIGEKYDYVFGGPGPDITTLRILEIKDDKVKAHDEVFDFDLEVDIADLIPNRDNDG